MDTKEKLEQLGYKISYKFEDDLFHLWTVFTKRVIEGLKLVIRITSKGEIDYYVDPTHYCVKIRSQADIDKIQEARGQLLQDLKEIGYEENA